MDLKSLDLDRVEAEIRESAADGREHFEKTVELKIREIRTAVEAARLLEKLPTGELIQRATLAEVIPVIFHSPDGRGSIHAAALSGSLEVRLDATMKDGSRAGPGYLRMDVAHRAPTPVVKTSTPYRLLVFLLEQEP